MVTDTLPTESRPRATVAPSTQAPSKGALPALAVLLAFLPLLYLYALSLWDRPHYQFFPFVLLGSAVLAWSRWRDVRPLTPGNRLVTLVGFVMAWALLALGEVLLAAGLAALGLLVLLAALLYGLGGWPFFRTLLPAWGFLWLAVHLPFGLDTRLVQALQRLTSQWSSNVLDTLGFYHVLAGNVVEISGRRLLVEEACAGLSSAFSLLACTLFLILWLRRPWFRSVLLLVAGLGWVLVANVVRIVTIVVASSRWNLDLSVGLKHDLLGLACFALAVVLLWSTDRLLLFFKLRETQPPSPAGNAGSAPGVSAVLRGLPRLLPWAAAVPFLLLLVLHLTVHGLNAQEEPTDRSVLPTVAGLDREALPQALGDWKQDGYYTEHRAQRSDNGEFSKTWIYKQGLDKAYVSLDYPFPDFHVLTVCYQGQGWSLEKLTEHREDNDGDAPGHWLEARLTRPGYRSGYLLYCEYNLRGEVLELEASQDIGVHSTWHRYQKALAKWRTRWSEGGDSQTTQVRGPAYQFQVFVEGNAPPTAAEQAAIQRLFFRAVKQLRGRMFVVP